MNPSLPPRKDTPSFWREHAAGTAFLHLGESPFPPSAGVTRAIAEAAVNLNRYPDTNALALRRRLAEYVGYGVGESNIIAGNGSDDLIDLAVVSFVDHGQCVLSFEPSFFYYHFTPQRHGLRAVSIQRNELFDLPDPQDARLPDTPALTFIANPNNPTGTHTERHLLAEWLEHLPGIVVVDECYFEFAGATVVDWIHHYDNLLVLRSLSKSFGIAGIRLGYAIAAPGLIETLERHALTFPVNALAQAAGIAALSEIEENQVRISSLIASRERLKSQLETLKFQVLPSRTNFLLALWPENCGQSHPAAAMKAQGVLVSDQTAALGVGRPALRIAVGVEAENRRLVEVIKTLLT